MVSWFGRGREKRVARTADTNKLEKQYTSNCDSEYARRSYKYLAEVATLLQIGNIQFPRRGEYDPVTRKVFEEMVHTSSSHNVIRNKVKRGQKPSRGDEKVLKQRLTKAGYKHGLDELKKYGIILDPAIRNYDVIDKQVWYLDDPKGWYLDQARGLVKTYSRSLIEQLATARLRERKISKETFMRIAQCLDTLDSLWLKEKQHRDGNW